MNRTIEVLRRHARQSASHAYVPYSKTPESTVLLLSDGTWIPGVRVESASFSLLIPALLNAYTTLPSDRRDETVAVVLDHPARPEEQVLLDSISDAFESPAPDVYVRPGAEQLPEPGERYDPLRPTGAFSEPQEGIEASRRAAAGAFVPISNYPVGCILQLDGGGMIPGSNVEHDDWNRILCAERNALGTAVTYGLTSRVTALYLACVRASESTPCGACRQLILELLPNTTLWMDRGDNPPFSASPDELLPFGFAGSHASRPSTSSLSPQQ